MKGTSLGYIGGSGHAKQQATQPAKGAGAVPVPVPVPAPAPAPAPQRREAVPARLLIGWNVAMGLFHAALAAVTLSVANVDLAVPAYGTDLKVTYYNETSKQFSDDLPDEGEKIWKVTPVYVEHGELYPTLLTAAFFLLSSLFHFLCVALSPFYLSELALCRTPLRWIEYSLSAPLMFVLIAYSVGVRSTSLLVAVAFLICVTMPFGYWTEVAARPASASEWADPLPRRLLPWIVGHVPQVVAWGIILSQFYDAGLDMSRIPWFVHLIVWLELAFFFSFGGAALLSQLLPPRLFYKGELGFQALSLLSKGSLGIILITNVLMLSRFDDIYEQG